MLCVRVRIHITMLRLPGGVCIRSFVVLPLLQECLVGRYVPTHRIDIHNYNYCTSLQFKSLFYACTRQDIPWRLSRINWMTFHTKRILCSMIKWMRSLGIFWSDEKAVEGLSKLGILDLKNPFKMSIVILFYSTSRAHITSLIFLCSINAFTWKHP